MQLGKFITLEGGEGVGKSTQITVVGNELLAAGLEVVVTREPGGTSRAERIREILLAPQDEPMPESCELLLMFAARATHLYNLILPALNRGAWVVCDRFTDATYAYQGYGRGLSLDFIAQLEQSVQQGLQPDLTLLLDAPIELAMQRAVARNHALGQAQGDRFEREQTAFFERVRQGYQARATAHTARFRVIDASQSLDTVSAAVRITIQQFLIQQKS
jgi:dTMP kinase